MEQRQKLYTGIAVCTLAAVNPDTGWLRENVGEGMTAPQYCYASGNCRWACVSVWLRTNPQCHTDNMGRPLERLFNLRFSLLECVRISPDGHRRRIIDSFARTAWADEKTFSEHSVPTDREGNMMAISNDWHPCLVGEEELTRFTRALLGIPYPMTRIDGRYRPIRNIDDAICCFNNLPAVFTGDFSEIYRMWGTKPQASVKVLVCLQRLTGGNLAQTVFNRYFSPPWAKTSKRFKAAVNNSLWPNTMDNSKLICTYEPLEEYTGD